MISSNKKILLSSRKLALLFKYLLSYLKLKINLDNKNLNYFTMNIFNPSLNIRLLLLRYFWININMIFVDKREIEESNF